MQDPQQLRKNIRSQRRQLSSQQRSQAANNIAQKLFALPEFQDAEHIACYLDNDGEVETNEIIYEILKQKNCYLPVINDELLSFAQYKEFDTLIENKFGIKEPQSNAPIIEAQQLDLVVVPLVAFDENCHRLGMGKGFYDKTFAFRKAQQTLTLIGLAYELQKQAFEVNDWDIPLNYIMTEQRLYSS